LGREVKPPATRIGKQLRLDRIALGLSVGAIINVQPVYAPFKLAAIGVHSAAVIGFCMMSFTVMGAISSPFYGRLRGFASAAIVFGVGFAVLAAGLAAFVFAPNVTVALLGYSLFGVAMGLVMANLYAVAADSNDPEQRGSDLGQALAGYFSAPLVVQLLLDIVAAGQPIRALMWLTSFCGVMSVAWLASGFRTRQSSGPLPLA